MSTTIPCNNGSTNIINNNSASSSKTTPSLTLKREVVLSTHKVLPANKVEKESLLIRPITSNCEKRVKKDVEQPTKQKPTVQYINYSPIKKKSYLQTLKDKIFSPGDFIPTKYESKNQKLIIELSKKLLASSSLLNNNLNSSTSSSSSHSHANSNSSSLSVSNLKNKIISNSNASSSATVKYLPDIKAYAGYIDSKASSQHKKTLILDLDETLVHSAFKPFYFKSDIVLNINFDNKLHTIHVLKRPYVDEFLEKMAKMFEIVIFTASIPEYANPLLNQLDTKKLISHRLFREHCTPSNNFFIKDLKKVGRDLKDTILLDNNPVSYLLNKHNGIPILTWHSSKTDTELIKLVPFLEYLSKVDDVRECIKKVINGNYVNYREVNKLINMNTNGCGVNNKHSTRSELFGIGNNDYTRNGLTSETNSSGNNNNNKESNNDIHKHNNVNNINVLSKKKFSTFYFDANTSTPSSNENELKLNASSGNSAASTHTKHIGDKIRESLNLNFNSHQSSPTNLFEDKVYKEKYKQFYDIKPSSSPNPFNQSLNGTTMPLQIPSSSMSSDFYSKAYEKKTNEIVVLPSNDCRSSSKNIKIKKLSSLTPSTNSNSTCNSNNIFNNLKHNESYSHLQNEKDTAFHSYRNSENYQHKNRHLPNYVSPLRESKKFDFFQKNQISSSLSKSLEKKQFDFNFMNNNNGDSRRSVGEHKIKRYTMTTQTATISLQEGNGSGSVGNYFSLGLTDGGLTRGGSGGNGVISNKRFLYSR